MEQPDAMTDHFWWRPGWAPGRAYLTWHVLPSPEVIAYAATLQERLRGLHDVAAVPSRRLHVTGPGVGFADELPPTRVADLVDHARRRLTALPAFTCDIAPAVAGMGGVYLPVGADELTVLRGVLRDAMRAVGLEPPGSDDEAYAPHLTLAYATGPASRHEVARRLAATDAVPRPTLAVGAATLLALRMVPPGYDWTERAAAPLEGPVHEPAATHAPAR